MPHDSMRIDQLSSSGRETRTGFAAKTIRPLGTRGWILIIAVLASTGWADPVAAQDWGESDDGWSSDSSSTSHSGGSSAWDEPAATRWSLRAGVGFIAGPDHFLMNFELPYRFDQYVSLGPMIQVGIANDRSIVAPTANLTITIPDLPGDTLDRFRPNVFAGIGFAVITDDDRNGDDRSAGFLINAGFGVDYVLSQRVSIGSRMILNFLPENTLAQNFFYSWEVVGVKLSF